VPQAREDLTMKVSVFVGTRLFGAISHDIALKHVMTQQYASGLVKSEYEVVVRT
jgi:hypothetical protein